MKARICTTQNTAPVSLDFRAQQMIQMADIDGHIPVSYTHLDVYKRQMERCTPFKIYRSFQRTF